jgi:hypothetical protein
MMNGIREDINQLINNYKSGDWDTYWMTGVVAISLYGMYFIYNMPC